MEIAIPKGWIPGVPHQQASIDPTWYSRALTTLRADRWYNWLPDAIHSADMASTLTKEQDDGHIPMVWKCNTDWVERIAPTSEPGSFWLLGNEPYVQSKVSPQEAVDAVTLWRQLAPDTGIGFPGIYWDIFEHGKQWLEEYVRLGGPMPDAWTGHFYPYTTRYWDNSFPEMLEFFRYIADLPFLLTETGGAYDDEELILGVMDRAAKAYRCGDARLVIWFSAYYEADFPWCDLLTENYELTSIGKHWMLQKPEMYLPQVEKA